MRRVIVDVDGTLWDLHTPLNKLLAKLYPGFPPDLPTDWNYFESYITKDQFYAAVDVVHKTQSDYPAFVGAGYLFNVLSQLDLEIVVASHRAPNTAHLLARWLNENDLEPCSILYTGNDKKPFIRQGDIVIDDAPATIQYALANGASSYYLSWPWNEKEAGSSHANLYELAVMLYEEQK